MPFGNSYDLVYGAERLEPNDLSLQQFMESGASDPIQIPSASTNEAARLIVDTWQFSTMAGLLFNVKDTRRAG